MSFKRKFKIGGLIGVLAVVSLMVAPIASAHHAVVSASLDCSGKITYTVTSWATGSEGTNPDVALQDSLGDTFPVPHGHFGSDDAYQFSGTFTISTSVASVTLTPRAFANWGDNVAGDTYSGNAITITRPSCGTPTLTTTASGPVTLGAAIHDTAHLSGGYTTLGGTVSFQVFAPSDTTCATPIAVTPAATVDGTGDYSSANYTTSAAGTYHWIAHYSGDANNNALDGTCGTEGESSTVNKTVPSIGTTLSSTSITAGGLIHDSASLTGATANAGGTVTYTVYTNSACSALSSNPAVNQTVTVASGAVPSSNSYTFPNAGTYYWQAAYSGDSNNAAATSPCTSEVLTVTSPPEPPAPPVVPPVTPPPPPPPSTPAITIVKDPSSQSIASGGTAKFTITVTNTGNVELTDVTVTDPLSPDCNHGIGALAAGQSTSYSCTRTNVTEAFENVATVTGTPPTGAPVQATDNANVKVAAPFAPPQRPAISIVKSPKLQTLTTKIRKTQDTAGAAVTTVSYGTANFAITVTNTGDVTLTGVKVVDLLSLGCSRNLGTLAAGKSTSYKCSKPTVGAGFTNVAVVSGQPPKGSPVSAKDHAVVKVASTTKSSQQTGGSNPTVTSKPRVNPTTVNPTTTASKSTPLFTG